MTNFILRLWGTRRHRAILLGVLAFCAPSAAQAELMLYPTRVVIESHQRSAQLQIVNRSDKPETYRIRIVNRRMTDTGEIVVADKAEASDRFADQMLVYTPRQVTLQSGASQTVRIAVRKPASLPDGEYRSHLQFDRVQDATAASDIEKIAQSQKGQLSIVLQALIGASIPVIIRQGETSASVTLDALAVSPAHGDTPPMLNFVFHRQGNRSVYGDVVATYAAPGKRPVEIANVDGIAVYVPNAMRRAQLPLTLPKGVSLHGGTITLKYTQPKDAGGKLIAESAMVVP